MKRHHSKVPIVALDISWPTKSHRRETELLEKGFLQFPEDLGMFGMDRGLHLWAKWADDLTRESEVLQNRVEELGEKVKASLGLTWQDPVAIANAAGGGAQSDRLRETVNHFGVKEEDVLKLYESFKSIDRDHDGFITAGEIYYWLEFPNGIKEFGSFAPCPFELVDLNIGERF